MAKYKVDILDLIKIDVFEPHPGVFNIELQPYEKGKVVVVDETALAGLNNALNEKMRGLSARDPNSKGYMEEFTGRLLSELYKNGLVEIDNAPEGHNDPYAAIRNKFVRR